MLEYRLEEGERVEPVHYVPVLPMLLINGAQGIGTGFSTCVPAHSTSILCAATRAYLAKQPLPELQPHFEGFKGTVEVKANAVVTHGTIERINDRAWRITELPLGRWTEAFLTELKALADGSKSIKHAPISHITNMSTEFSVHIEIKLSEEVEEEQLVKALRLHSSFSMANMQAFDTQYLLNKYDSPRAIFEEHAQARLRLYEKRRAHQLEQLQAKLDRLQGKVEFIRLVTAGELPLRGVPRAELVEQLRGMQLPEIDDYEYLLNMNISSFTQERIKALQQEAENTRAALLRLREQQPADLWLADLEVVEKAFADYLKRLEQRHADVPAAGTTTRRKARASQPPAKKRR